jgi:hypothetical protein
MATKGHEQRGPGAASVNGLLLAAVVVSSIEGGIMLSRLERRERPLKTCLECLKAFLRFKAR